MPPPQSTPRKRRSGHGKPPPNLYHPSRSTNYINYPVNENLRNILFWLDLRLSFKLFLMCLVVFIMIGGWLTIGFILRSTREYDSVGLEDNTMCYVIIGVQGSEALQQCKCVAALLDSNSNASPAEHAHDQSSPSTHQHHHHHQATDSYDEEPPILSEYTANSDIAHSIEEPMHHTEEDSLRDTSHPSNHFIITEVSNQFYKEYIWRQLHSVPQPRTKDPLLYRLWMSIFKAPIHFYKAGDSPYHNEEIGDEEIIIKQDILQDVQESVQKHPVFVYGMPHCDERQKEIIGGVSQFARWVQQNRHAIKQNPDVLAECNIRDE